MAYLLLGQIRNVYVALHQDSDSAPTRFAPSTSDHDRILRDPTSYPVCIVPGHHLASRAHIKDDKAPTTLSRAVPHDDDNVALIPSFLARSRDTSSASAHGPLHVDESLTDAIPLDNDSVQTNPEGHRVPSPDPVTTLAIHRSADTNPKTIHLPHRNLRNPALLPPRQRPRHLHQMPLPLTTLFSATFLWAI